MKSMIKLILEYVKRGDSGKAKKILPKVVSSIDTCSKKNIIHKNNAARKKARIQKALNNLEKGGAVKEVKEVKEEAKEKKVEKKVEEKVEEKAEKEAPEKEEKAKK
jgi:hypothetical protein